MTSTLPSAPPTAPPRACCGNSRASGDLVFISRPASVLSAHRPTIFSGHFLTVSYFIMYPTCSSYGAVHKATYIETSHVVAIKQVPLDTDLIVSDAFTSVPAFCPSLSPFAIHRFEPPPPAGPPFIVPAHAHLVAAYPATGNYPGDQGAGGERPPERGPVLRELPQARPSMGPSLVTPPPLSLWTTLSLSRPPLALDHPTPASYLPHIHMRCPPCELTDGPSHPDTSVHCIPLFPPLLVGVATDHHGVLRGGIGV